MSAPPSRPALSWQGRGRVLALVALLLFYLPLHGLWRLFGLRSPWPRRFLGVAARAIGADVRVVGRPLRGPVLYAANHLSWLDILVVAGATGARFVAKDEIRGWPVIGWLAGLNRTVFVVRAARGQVQDQARQLREALDDPAPVVLFPEGGTGDGMRLDPFRASLFAAVVSAPFGTFVQPLAIDYGPEARLVAWPREAGTGEEAVRLLSLPGRRAVTLRFCDPIDPATLPDRKAIAAAVQRAVAAALGQAPLGETAHLPV